jgi:hypothetical protein
MLAGRLHLKSGRLLADLAPQKSQIRTTIVALKWTGPLSLNCRTLSSFDELQSRPVLHKSQRMKSSSLAIGRPYDPWKPETLVLDGLFCGCVSYFTATEKKWLVEYNVRG